MNFFGATECRLGDGEPAVRAFAEQRAKLVAGTLDTSLKAETETCAAARFASAVCCSTAVSSPIRPDRV
jgi:hypothetical protein